MEEQLEKYREVIVHLGSKLYFFTCDELRDYLRDYGKEIDIIEFANIHIAFLKENNRAPYSRTFRKIRKSLVDYFGRPQVTI